jgi:alpha-tubulin suppressor-like RCC1 family protein
MLHAAGVEECTCGQVYMWGDNAYGQLGQGDSMARFNPTLVQELNGNEGLQSPLYSHVICQAYAE